MAKKNSGFDFGGYFDQDALNLLIDAKGTNAPTKDEVELIEKAEGDVIDIPLGDLIDYHNHTYKVLDNEDMDALVDSISDMGIILPLLVRKTDDDKYEVIAGHRRKRAASILGLETVPCKVTEADDATADIMMVDTNLHREEISPSEKARSYDVRIAAMKEKGLIAGGSEGDRKYEEDLAKDIKSSRANIFRYRKLLDLVPELLELVDKKKIAVNAGAKIATIPKDQQKAIVEALEETSKPVTMDIADKLVKGAGSGLTKERALEIIEGKLKPKKKAVIKKAEVKEKDFSKSLPKAVSSLEAKERADFITACVEEYVKTHDTWNDIPLK